MLSVTTRPPFCIVRLSGSAPRLPMSCALFRYPDMISFLRSPRFGKAVGTTPASFPRVRSEGTGRVTARPRDPLSGAGAKRHGGGASRRRFAWRSGDAEAGMRLVQTAWPEGTGAGSVCMRINLLFCWFRFSFVSYDNIDG